MSQLADIHDWLHKQFQEKDFPAVRQSAKFWAALSTDLTIEQVMIKSIKRRVIQQGTCRKYKNDLGKHTH